MQIRLKPVHPNPNILFNLALTDPTFTKERHAIPTPHSWNMQKQAVEMMHEEGFAVELTRDMHGFDKAAWHTALLSEVVFDAAELVISCTFVDGHTVSWPLPSERGPGCCLTALENVVMIVQQAAEITLQEKMQMPQVSMRAHHGSSGAYSAPVSPVSTLSGKGHKRQRSLLSSLFAAVKGALSENPGRASTLPAIKIPSSSHSRTLSTFSRTQQSPPASPTTYEPPSTSTFALEIRPRAPIPPPRHSKPRTQHEQLRAQARSALVDIIRRYVLPVFSTTGSPSFANVQCPPGGLAQLHGFPPGLYPAWACRSLLRRTEERMREMLSEANAHGLGHVLRASTSALRQSCSTASRDPYEEDDDLATVSATSVSTETDGSSVHTPVDSPLPSPFTPVFASPLAGPPRLSSIDIKAPPPVPRSPSPPSPDFDVDASTYNALGNLRSRLQTILHKMGSTPRQIACGPPYDSNLTVLEIKSRRRAWSARDYVGGARMSLLGLAAPFRSSDLARCEPITAEMLAQMQAAAAAEPEPRHRGGAAAGVERRPSFAGAQDVFAEFGVSVGVKAVTKELDAQLFPVCEEDEEEEEDDHDDRHRRRHHGLGAHYGRGLDEFEEDEWREVQEFDLESGLLAFPRPEHHAAATPADANAPPTYAHLHPMTRTRTQSIRRDRSGSPPVSGGALSSSSLLCQPLSKKEVQVPVMLDEEGSFGCEDLGQHRGGEFTLGMDLPPPPRGWMGEDSVESCR